MAAAAAQTAQSGAGGATDEGGGVATLAPAELATGTGNDPAHPQESPRPRRSHHRVVRMGVGLVLAVALALARGQAYAFVRDRWLDKGPPHPSAWDPRVVDLVSFVENERGLRFDHPVYIDFIEEKTFQASMRSDKAEMTDDERQEVEDATAMFRALGLINNDVDLLDATNDLQSEGTLAFYRFDNERITVRGTELTPGTRVTLVHELTHALQDQTFDLGRIQAKAESETEGQESDVLRGLAEGDAGRIEDAYRDSLNEADRKAADEAEAKDSESFDVDKFPPVLTAFFGAPYAFGDQLVGLLDAADGQAGIDDAFRTPPKYDETLLDPLGYLVGEIGEDLTTPELRDGEKEIDHSGFGAFGLYLVLAQRIDLKQALRVSDGWAGDSFIGYRSGDDVCVRAAFLGDDPDATKAIGDALEEWVRPAKPGSASVTRGEGVVQLQTCDAKADAPISRNVSVEDLFLLPLVRAGVGKDMIESGATASQARCFATGVLDALSIEQLKAKTMAPAEEARLQQLAASCRST